MSEPAAVPVIDPPIEAPSGAPGKVDHAEPARLAALDGFRGLAVLTVFVYHVVLLGDFGAGTPLTRLFRAVGLGGWIGVDLFFVLSGFLITGILLDTRGRPGWLRRFYIRRALRIIPAYYLALLTLAVVQAASGTFDLAQFGWTGSWLTNVLIARNGWAALPTTMHHYWSLAVEEQFYLLWPFAVAFLSPGMLLLLCAGLVVDAGFLRIALIHSNLPAGAYVLLPARIDGLSIGALLAILARWRGGLGLVARLVKWPTLLTGCGLVALMVSRGGFLSDDQLVLTLGINLIVITAGGLMVLGVAGGPTSGWSRFLEAKWLRYLGTYSYAIYLWHQPVIYWLTRLGLGATSAPRIGGSDVAGLLLLGGVAGAVSIGLALVSWRLVEGPAARLKERLTARQSG